MTITAGDICLHYVVRPRLRVQIEKLIKSVIRKGFFCPDNEFLVNAAFALTYPVYLAYRQSHSLG